MKKSARRPSQSNLAVPVVASAEIQIRGARTHNLKAVDVVFPHDQWIVITGPSGCGKSSLAIDTLFAEGQRQFIETLSVFTRQYLDQMPAADVDWIEGLLPTVKIDQQISGLGPRSTVGTITEIHDYLRLLYARCGDVHCHQCGDTIGQQTVNDMERWVMRLPEGTRLMVLAPLVRDRKGKHGEVLERVRSERLVRVRVDGQLWDIDELPALDARQNHTLEAITDRIVIREGVNERLREALDLALRLTGRLVAVAYQAAGAERQNSDWQEKLFSTEFACPRCEISYPEIEPRTFSFNSPNGCCGECQGLGQTEQFDLERLFPDRSLSLLQGALAPWQTLSSRQINKRLEWLEPVFRRLRITPDQPLADLTAKQWESLWNGSRPTDPSLRNLIEKEWSTASDAREYETWERCRSHLTCPSCQGTRLGPTALAVTIDSVNLGQLSRLSINDLRDRLPSWRAVLNSHAASVPLLDQIEHRLNYLSDVGLGYLTLERSGPTLSGGELQRVRLAAAIGTGLTNVCFILDEPSIGLHSRDSARLIATIERLRDSGNTVVVVEHDEAMMRAADRVIDMGPGSGRAGGEIVAEGTWETVIASGRSTTADYLSGRRQIPVPTRRSSDNASRLQLVGARGRNLKNVSAEFLVGRFNAVSGVSGSGKSTLVNGTLAPALFNRLQRFQRPVEPHDALIGGDEIARFVEIDQHPIGRNSRSCAATYTGVWDEVRQLYAQTKIAKQLGFTANRFSFNSGPGRCTDCGGVGEKKLSMNFLPDLNVTCHQCSGHRFNPATLAVRFQDLTIADVLERPIGEIRGAFANIPKIDRVLMTLCEVGLDYLALGQSATTLSGGEAQRVKLATELAQSTFGPTVYLLDEPTTGLHFEDVRRLLSLLQKLVDLGHTVIVIEHHLDVLKSADWLIDLGPEGGAGGGEIIGQGPPEMIAALPHSHTGRFLAPLLAR